MAFFELRTPRDMLDKAERELARLGVEFTIDNIFNFFVTAYHIQDYIKATKAVPKAALQSFLADADLTACRDMCDKGKHLQLTQRPYPDPIADIADGCFSGAAYDELAYGEGEEWKLLYNDRAVEVRSLADRVMAKWKTFLDSHGL